MSNEILIVDDNPDITSYLLVIDITNLNYDEGFVFNVLTFSSSPSLRPFDHPGPLRL